MRHWLQFKSLWYTIGTYLTVFYEIFFRHITKCLLIFREYLGKQLQKEDDGSGNQVGGGNGPAPIQGKA